MSEEETEKAFVNPNEDDNDEVSVFDDTRDELLYAYILQYSGPAIAQNYLFIYSSIFCSSK
jgi:hypothetical protein